MLERSEVDYTKELLDYPETIRRCVAIFFYGRSGSYLLSSFLDGHPHVLQILPTGMQQFYFAHGERRIPSGGTPREFAEKIADAMPELFRTTVGNQRSVDRTRFCGFLARSVESLAAREVIVEPGVLCNAIHVSHQAALGAPVLTKDPVVACQLHVPSEHRFRFIRLLYPRAKLLYTVREPAQSANSYFRHHLLEAPNEPYSALTRGIAEQMLLTGDLPADEDATTMAAVRFEDLHLRTEAAMRAVAAWLDIPWHPSLVASTFNGDPWWYDNGTIRFTGARPEQAAVRPTRYMSYFDTLRWGRILRKEYAAWGYANPYEELPPLFRRLYDRWLFDLPTKMELAAFVREWGDLLARLWEERKTIAEFVRNERRRHGDPRYRELPILDPEDG